MMAGAVFGDWITGPDARTQSVPQKALDVASQIDQTGQSLPGYKGARRFKMIVEVAAKYSQKRLPREPLSVIRNGMLIHTSRGQSRDGAERDRK